MKNFRKKTQEDQDLDDIFAADDTSSDYDSETGSEETKL
jgi:hypothetical protein